MTTRPHLWLRQGLCLITLPSSARSTIRRALILLGLAGLYAPVFSDIARTWLTQRYAGHGVFVPAFSLFRVLWDWERIRAAAGRPNAAGIPVIFLSLATLAVGRWSGSLLVQNLSLVTALAGGILWACGEKCLRAVAFPVAFLLFMVPLPNAIAEWLTLRLQVLAATLAGVALTLFDFPFEQSGADIALPTTTIHVAETCNGLRFLTALVVVTIAFAYISQRTLFRGVLLVASTIPIAILANAVRVTTIVAGVYYIGPQVTGSDIHESLLNEDTIAAAVLGLTLIPVAALGLLLRRGTKVGVATPP